MKAKAKKKAVRKTVDPCGARKKTQDEYNHDYWEWQYKALELDTPASALRSVMGDFEESYRAEFMTYLGDRNDTDEINMYQRLTTALDNLCAIADQVEEASKQMKQRHVSEKWGYMNPKTKKWVEVSTGRDDTTNLVRYKDI